MIIAYILQVTVCLASFYAFYHFALQRETLFQSNRIYLITTLLASLIMPLTRIYIQNQQHEPSIVIAPYMYVGSYLNAVGDAIKLTPDDESIFWPNILLIIYFIGILLLSIKMTREIAAILRMKANGERAWISNQLCIISNEVKSPFSFFRTIYLPSHHHFKEDELSEIIAHERAHVLGRHTADILFMELVCILLWLSPIVYLYRKKLREVHEFLADAEVLKNTTWENYASFLVAQKGVGLQNHLSNQMFYSQLKNRLKMMTQRPSTFISRYKYLGIIPILFLALIIFSFREKSVQEQNHSKSDSKVNNLYEDGLKIFSNNEMNHDRVNFQVKDTMPVTYINAMRLSEPKSDVDLASENKAALDSYDNIAVFPGCDDVPIQYQGMCGQENMIGFINTHLVYPESLKKAGIEGKVIIRFTVGIDGFIKNIAIEKSLHPDADQAALDVIKRMNKEAGRWLPARKAGKTMEAEMWLPISFTLGQKIPEQSEVRKEEAFTFVEEMPQFPGSNEAMFNYIYQAIKYPKEDREKGNEGMVIVQFIVEDDGSISNAKVVRGVSPGINDEALRVVNGMNDLPEKWIPGRHQGRAVPVQFTLPLKFILQPSQQDQNQNLNKAVANPSVSKDDAENHDLPLAVFFSPNPVSDVLKIEFSTKVESSSIMDGLGRVVWQKKFQTGNDNMQSIDVSKWSPGTYIVQSLDGAQTYSSSFVVQH